VFAADEHRLVIRRSGHGPAAVHMSTAAEPARLAEVVLA
jgi:hypothetical protein